MLTVGLLIELLCLPHPLKHTIAVLRRWDMSNTCQTETTFAFLSAIFISGVTATPIDVNIISIEKVNTDYITVVMEFCFMCLRNHTIFKPFQLCVCFPVAILETLVEISELFLRHFLVNTYSGKVTKAYITILIGNTKGSAKCTGCGKKSSPLMVFANFSAVVPEFKVKFGTLV